MNFQLPDITDFVKIAPSSASQRMNSGDNQQKIVVSPRNDNDLGVSFGKANQSKVKIENTPSIEATRTWLADSSVDQIDSKFNLKEVLRELGLNPTESFGSFEEFSDFKTKNGERLEVELQKEIRNYIFKPLADLLPGKDLNNLSEADNKLLENKLSNLSPEEERKLVQSTFDRANQLANQIVKDISLDSNGSDPQKYLRAKVLSNLVNDLKYITNETFESLPSFKGKDTDNEKILSEKFGLVYNISNDDFINETIDYKKNFSNPDDYFSAPRTNELGDYPAFVKISGEKDVPDYIQNTLKNLFPTVDSANFKKINTVDDPAMSFRGANIPTDGGNSIAIINPKNIAAVANKNGITDPVEIQKSEESIIANELTHSAMNKLFGDLSPDKSFFNNYKDESYRKMNNLQFNELISDVTSAVINPDNAITESLKTNESRYEYSKLTTQNYLKNKGFSAEEIQEIELTAPEKRQEILMSLAQKKNINIRNLNTEYRDYLLAFGRDLINHAQSQKKN